MSTQGNRGEGDGAETQQISIWDRHIQEIDQSKWRKLEEMPTIFILGSKSAGKTSLVWQFMGKHENPHPTLLLDFSYATRLTSDYTKEVAHVWELGGDSFKYPNLIETPILNINYLNRMTVFLVLDLSKPEVIWHTLETAITHGRKAVKKHLSKMSKQDALGMTEKLEEGINKRLGKDPKKGEQIEPFPLPLVIIGTKYDIFQDFEPEKRKAISRVLRLASHRLGASLNYYSLNDIALNRRVKELFAHYSYGTPFPKGTNLDLNKPLLIPPSGDSYEQIGNNPSQITMEFLKHLFESTIGKYDEKTTLPPNPSLDPKYKDEDFDETRKRILEKVKVTEKVRSEFAIGDEQFRQRF